MKAISPLKVALLGAALLVLGFVVGLGYQSRQNSHKAAPPKPAKTSKPQPPAMRALRVSPDDRLLAFTIIYQHYKQAARVVFDLKNSSWDAEKSPAGWQDMMVQWGKDKRTMLFERSKIPPLVAPSKSGVYSDQVQLSPKTATPHWNNQQFLSKELHKSGQKTYAGLWTPGGQLVVKTRHTSKSLFTVKNGKMHLLDHSPGTYYQNRAISKNGKLSYYVVRDVDAAQQAVALYKIQNGKREQLGPQFTNVIWAYLSENGQWLLVCKNAANNEDWKWQLWRVEEDNLTLTKTRQVPGDIIAVYWSPNFKHILGAVGSKLWLTDVPSLKTRQIGTRDDWHADDAAWLNKQNAVLVAAAGVLWKVDIKTGKRIQLWKLPQEYWNSKS